MVIGTLIIGTGVTLLFLAFRRFGLERPGDTSPLVIIGVLLLFIAACCAALLRVSYLGP